jgi:hypothetical protein
MFLSLDFWCKLDVLGLSRARAAYRTLHAPCMALTRVTADCCACDADMFAHQQADVGRLQHVSKSSSMCMAGMSQGHAAHCCNVLNMHSAGSGAQTYNTLQHKLSTSHNFHSQICLWPALRCSMAANLVCLSQAGTHGVLTQLIA